MDKNQSEKKPGRGLCKGCHFDSGASICNHTQEGLSPRAINDIKRHSKFVAWFLGYKEVTPDIIKAIAPYAIWHRVNPTQRFFYKPPYFASKKLEFVKDLVNRSIEYTLSERMDSLMRFKEALLSDDRVKVENAISYLSSLDDLWLKHDLANVLRERMEILKNFKG